MTGKEALDEIKDYTLVTYDEDGNEEDCIRFGELEPNLIEPIKRDLEVLEIIKQYSFFGHDYKNGERYDYFKTMIHTIGMKEEYEKIKQWLGEE